MTHRISTRSGRTVALLLVLCCVSLTTACTPDETKAEPTPSPTSTPPFATDEEALEAARTTYEGFLRVSDSVLADGGADSNRIDEFAASKFAESEKEGAQRFQERGLRIEGSSTVTAFELQRYSRAPNKAGHSVVAYVCVDDAGVVVVDGNGVFDRPPETVGKLTFEATFDFADESATRLLVSSNELWAGEGVC